jgi:hypothetical protein
MAKPLLLMYWFWTGFEHYNPAIFNTDTIAKCLCNFFPPINWLKYLPKWLSFLTLASSRQARSTTFPRHLFSKKSYFEETPFGLHVKTER